MTEPNQTSRNLQVTIQELGMDVPPYGKVRWVSKVKPDRPDHFKGIRFAIFPETICSKSHMTSSSQAHSTKGWVFSLCQCLALMVCAVVRKRHKRAYLICLYDPGIQKRIVSWGVFTTLSPINLWYNPNISSQKRRIRGHAPKLCVVVTGAEWYLQQVSCIDGSMVCSNMGQL